jgi:hypothetical protein
MTTPRDNEKPFKEARELVAVAASQTEIEQTPHPQGVRTSVRLIKICGCNDRYRLDTMMGQPGNVGANSNTSTITLADPTSRSRERESRGAESGQPPRKLDYPV